MQHVDNFCHSDIPIKENNCQSLAKDGYILLDIIDIGLVKGNCDIKNLPQ